MADDLDPLKDELVAFFEFVEASKRELDEVPMSEKNRALSAAVEAKMEVEKESPSGTRYREMKHDSALYRDIDRMAHLVSFVSRYPLQQRKRFRALIDLELNGLEGDLAPKNMLTGTAVAAIFTGGMLVLSWFALWQTFWGFDMGKAVVDAFIFKVKANAWLSFLAEIVFFIGGFVAIALFVTFSHANRKQVAYYRTLSRALDLQLLVEGSDV